MTWSCDDAEVKPQTATTSAGTEMVSGDSTQVTQENFHPQSARLSSHGGSHEDECRSTAFSLCSSQGCTPRDPRWRDTQVRERLNTARLLRKAVEQQFQARSPPCKEWSGGILQKLRKRVAMTEGLIQNLLRRIEGTGALIRRVDQSLYLLSQNRQSLDGPIEICERRLLIRTQRPEEESVQDDFQQALEHEEQVLASGNKHLNAYIEAGNQLHEALQAAKIEMVEDLQFKKHALRLEKSALQFDPYHGRDRACVLPMVADKGEMQSSGKSEWKFGSTHRSLEPDGEEGASENVRRSARHTNELLTRTQKLEADAAKYLEDSVELLRRVKEKVQVAREGTNTCMQASISHHLEQKIELERGVADSQADIARMEALLQHMEKEIQSQQASLDDWEASPEISLERFDQRLPLAVQQDMRLSAMDRMQEQVHKAKSNVKTLSNKREQTQEILSRLKASKEDLQQHLRAKTVSWNLDLQCSKLAVSANCSKDETRSLLLTLQSKESLNVVPPASKLSDEAINLVRSRIKAAAYVGPNGQGIDVMFRRFDKDGSGSLDAREVRRALRRSLRIPATSVSDQQIFSLCALLDLDGSGAVDIAELVAFIGNESLEGPRGLLKEKLNTSLGKVSTSFDLDCFVSPRWKDTKDDSQRSSQRRRLPELSKSALDDLRSKIKAASYAGQFGSDMKALFSRFDRNGSGVLEVDEVRQALRRSRIPKTSISDEQISRLCAMVDTDGSGAISITELVEFVGQEPSGG